MSSCGGCAVGNSLNPGGHYIGIRINENEDGRVVFCDTNGMEVRKGLRVVVEGDVGFEYAEVMTLHPMIVKQCQLKEARRLVRVANESDLSTYNAKRQREEQVLRDTKELASERTPRDEADPGRRELRRP